MWCHSWLRRYTSSWLVAGSVADEVNGFLAGLILQPPTEMNTRNLNLPGDKGQPAHQADSLTAFCEPAHYKMWEL
jgi:hypothetical protein